MTWLDRLDMVVGVVGFVITVITLIKVQGCAAELDERATGFLGRI